MLVEKSELEGERVRPYSSSAEEGFTAPRLSEWLHQFSMKWFLVSDAAAASLLRDCRSRCVSNRSAERGSCGTGHDLAEPGHACGDLAGVRSAITQDQTPAPALLEKTIR